MLRKLHRRLNHLDQLIKLKATGSPKELANKLGITERAWYKFRDQLINDLHVPIKYCPISQSYVYTEEGRFEMGFHKLTREKTAGLNGRGVHSSFNRNTVETNSFLFNINMFTEKW